MLKKFSSDFVKKLSNLLDNWMFMLQKSLGAAKVCAIPIW
jgi:hypothetical protein